MKHHKRRRKAVKESSEVLADLRLRQLVRCDRPIDSSYAYCLVTVADLFFPKH